MTPGVRPCPHRTLLRSKDRCSSAELDSAADGQPASPKGYSQLAAVSLQRGHIMQLRRLLRDCGCIDLGRDDLVATRFCDFDRSTFRSKSNLPRLHRPRQLPSYVQRRRIGKHTPRRTPAVDAPPRGKDKPPAVTLWCGIIRPPASSGKVEAVECYNRASVEDCGISMILDRTSCHAAVREGQQPTPLRQASGTHELDSFLGLDQKMG